MSRPLPARTRSAGAAVACATLLLLLDGSSLAKAEESQPKRSPRPTTGGPYCGIYSLYAALLAEGTAVTFDDLAQPKYVGSRFGSSLAELRQAAVDFGAHSVPLEGLTVNSLRAAGHPVILHVRRPGFGTQFLHWVLFLGTEGGKARILDPPNPVELISFAELMSLSDGVGLVIAAQPPYVWHLRGVAWAEQVAALLLATAVVITAYRLKGGRPKPQPEARSVFRSIVASIPGAMRLFGLAGAFAGAAHLLNADGFFWSRPAIAQVAGRYFEAPLPELTVAEVASLSDAPGVAVVDARLPHAFEAGHIPQALNLPISAGLAERAEVASRIRPEDRVIVYCQNKRCPWAKSVASDLFHRGYRQAAVFPGGWVAWQEYERGKSSR